MTERQRPQIDIFKESGILQRVKDIVLAEKGGGTVDPNSIQIAGVFRKTVTIPGGRQEEYTSVDVTFMVDGEKSGINIQLSGRGESFGAAQPLTDEQYDVLISVLQIVN